MLKDTPQKGYRVVSWDPSGTGESSRHDDHDLWSVDYFVEEAEAICSALDCGTVHMLGHSWGGVQALEYYLKYPQKHQDPLLHLNGVQSPHDAARFRAHEANTGIFHHAHDGASRGQRHNRAPRIPGSVYASFLPALLPHGESAQGGNRNGCASGYARKSLWPLSI